MKYTHLLFAVVSAHAAEIPYAPCPLIGAYYPPPSASTVEQANFSDVQSSFDKVIRDGGSPKYGPISRDTSFSVVYFTGGNTSLFEYQYTSDRDKQDNITVSSDKKLPIGDVTMVFTVYTWLVTMGQDWSTPITQFLPNLANSVGSIPWKDITIGDLAGHLSGLVRSSAFVQTVCVITANARSKYLYSKQALRFQR